MIPEEVLQRIDDETDIVALVSEFVNLEKSGKGYKGLCPFHDDSNPSFSVSTEKNIAMCMTCGGGGRPINFYRKIKNISFAEAAFDLGKRIGINIDIKRNQDYDKHNQLFDLTEEALKFYQINLTNSKSGLEVLDYLNKRSIDQELIRDFSLGYAPNEKDTLYRYLKSKDYSTTDMLALSLVKQAEDGSYYDFYRNRLMFPITNRYGRAIAFSARALDKNEKSKYINSPESDIFKKTNVLYNISEATIEIKKLDQIIIFEGFFDVIQAYKSGIKNVVATMGTSLTKEHAQIIKSVTNNVVLSFDGDNAGVKATLQTLKLLSTMNLNLNVLELPNKLDPDDYIKKFGKDNFLELVKTKKVDSYEFEYNYYLNNTNFNNASERITFQNNVVKMLETSPAAISSLYKEKLADKLKINITDIVVNRTTITEPPIFIEPKGKPIRLENRYEQAEKRLLILMMRSTVWFERINHLIDINDYSMLVLSTIRTKLTSYYIYNNEFDLGEFKSYLNNDELDYFVNEIQKDEYWVNQTILEEYDINRYLDLLKGTSLIRRMKYLQSVMIEKAMLKEPFVRENEELKEINLKLQKLKEESNEF